ncbi:MAG: beta-lactamase [Thermomicrobiales bacterium]|nr:beta-lactamase [Thermomicrobiales bacterium]
MDEWVGPQGVPGVGAVVWSGGEIVAERYAGEASPGVPVTRETLFPLASVTKPISAATFMALVDDGKVSLDEPVGRLLPEFRAGPQAGADGVDAALERLRPAIGARQLLCHVSGLPEDLGPRESGYQEGATVETVIDQMCRLPLQSAPGNELRYSNAGYGVIARLSERISGQPFWQAAQSHVFAPLGIREIVSDPAALALGRVAHESSRNGHRNLQQCLLAGSCAAMGRTLRHAARCGSLCRCLSSLRRAIPLGARDIVDDDGSDHGGAGRCGKR